MLFLKLNYSVVQESGNKQVSCFYRLHKKFIFNGGFRGAFLMNFEKLLGGGWGTHVAHACRTSLFRAIDSSPQSSGQRIQHSCERSLQRFEARALLRRRISELKFRKIQFRKPDAVSEPCRLGNLTFRHRVQLTGIQKIEMALPGKMMSR